MRQVLTHPVITWAIVLTVCWLLWLQRRWARDARIDVTKIGKPRRNYVVDQWRWRKR